MHRKAAFIIGVAMALTPVLASAQTSSTDLQALINQLLAQVQLLQQKVQQSSLSSTPTQTQSSTGTETQTSTQTESTNCADLSGYLAKGSTDYTAYGQVTKLQNFLQNTGYFTYTGAKGYYGSITASAVSRYQAAHGLPVTGTVSSATLAAMACHRATAPTPTVPTPVPTATINEGTLSASTGGKDAAAANISGVASNVSHLTVKLDGADGGNGAANVSVVYGHWSVTFTSVFPGTHSVTVIDADSGSSYGRTLTTGTLTVTATSQPTVTPAPTCSMTGSSAPALEPTTISWSSTNATTVTGLFALTSNTEVNGSATISIGQTTTYYMTFTGPGGKATCSATVYITAKPSASLDNSSMEVSTGGATTATYTLTGSAQSTSVVGVVVSNSKGVNFYGRTLFATVPDTGRWSVQLPGLPMDTYNIQLTNDAGTQIYDSGTLVVSGIASIGACPTNTAGYSSHSGATYSCTCPAGFALGTVWGSNVSFYWDNSNLCTAGIQAGQLNQASGGMVDFTVHPAQNQYTGTNVNGVSSQSYSGYSGGSFQVTGPKG